MSDEPAVWGYVVSPGEGVPDRTPDVKASGRSTSGSLTVMELARRRRAAQTYPHPRGRELLRVHRSGGRGVR
jgi:hypothetical protein